jgi:hypothetical protein
MCPSTRRRLGGAPPLPTPSRLPVRPLPAQGFAPRYVGPIRCAVHHRTAAAGRGPAGWGASGSCAYHRPGPKLPASVGPLAAAGRLLSASVPPLPPREGCGKSLAAHPPCLRTPTAAVGRGAPCAGTPATWRPWLSYGSTAASAPPASTRAWTGVVVLLGRSPAAPAAAEAKRRRRWARRAAHAGGRAAPPPAAACGEQGRAARASAACRLLCCRPWLLAVLCYRVAGSTVSLHAHVSSDQVDHFMVRGARAPRRRPRGQ